MLVNLFFLLVPLYVFKKIKNRDHFIDVTVLLLNCLLILGSIPFGLGLSIFWYLYNKDKIPFFDLIGAGKHFLEDMELSDYRKKHPQQFKGGKFIGCHNCGNNSIYMKQVGNTSYGIHHSHICRQCGQELWRSNM
ncbi:hypothetical protein N2M06_07505 [Oceanimonas sp. AH20CE76]|uniref:hypothetical protein n=1 Tax=Oceanimonas sp. AH20CE76 TaxID=2977120 RepID=UPI0031FF3242